MDKSGNSVEWNEDVVQVHHTNNERQQKPDTHHGNHRADGAEEVVGAVFFPRSVADKTSFELLGIFASCALLGIQALLFA